MLLWAEDEGDDGGDEEKEVKDEDDDYHEDDDDKDGEDEEEKEKECMRSFVECKVPTYTAAHDSLDGEAARNYDDNIFSTIDEDKTGIISQTIEACFKVQDSEFESVGLRSMKACARKEGSEGRCVDLGCGVVAYDLSPKLVALAQKEVKNLHITNVQVSVRDLSQVWYRLEPISQFGHLNEMESYNFAVLTNVLIAPGDPNLHQRMLLNAYRSVCPGGRVLCIVPAWESAMYVNMRCDEEKYEGPYSVGVAGQKPTRAEGADVVKGILRRSGVRTKHYLEPEFRHLAAKVEMCERVEYSWRSELGLSSDCQVPPRLQDSPLPWDWLFLLQRPGSEASPSRGADSSQELLGETLSAKPTDSQKSLFNLIRGAGSVSQCDL
ncbi:hypothetical protein AK812_SmicGene622 [Symbiodinium microadriaticum]|uniref:Methyltransferase domain-containing protein n=1 Tax=Symbiodinium microadriaticum TaxID=2951 RepID=A0A1Q9F666_SYMMI|nr:hypothetical protein AK812_SmicGene622 [Symbiodinium microadriaticum]